MKKQIYLLLCCLITSLFLTQITHAENSVKIIKDINDFHNFLYGLDTHAQLNNDIVLDSLNISTLDVDIDMNGYSFIIPSDVMICIKASDDNKAPSFYTEGTAPIFKVSGILELYAGKLSSTQNGSLIEVENDGRLYTRNPLVESQFYNHNNDTTIGRPSIYDNQAVKLTIPSGTAIKGGKEEAYYHIDIEAKTVIESSTVPTFYYSTVKSSQKINMKQGIYNDIHHIKNIPIFKHQLVMAIDNAVTAENIEKYLPQEIATKDSQYITVHFDTSTFDESLLEQTLYGEYHNINSIYLPYLPKLELKIIKNQKVPMSQFYTTFSGINSLFEAGILSPHPIAPRVDLHINYTNANQLFLEYSSNIDFINSVEKEIDTDGYEYPCTFSIHNLPLNETLYFRLHIIGGLQEGYSNIIKIDHCQMSYISEPDSQWVDDTKNDETIVVPPPSIDNDITTPPQPLPNEGSDHRNDASIQNPKDESEVVIKKDEIQSNIKAEQDILVELKDHLITIPYEIAAEYANSDITVSENEDNVQVTVNEKNIDIEKIEIKQQLKKESKHFYLGYMFVSCGTLITGLYFFKYKRRIK